MVDASFLRAFNPTSTFSQHSTLRLLPATMTDPAGNALENTEAPVAPELPETASFAPEVGEGTCYVLFGTHASCVASDLSLTRCRFCSVSGIFQPTESVLILPSP